ncbi:MAG TPA: Ig-like domain-containing protein, partial [Desertimonas sp.]|nr:Ig-like domain-containing protein [Desertimonas sp.]
VNTSAPVMFTITVTPVNDLLTLTVPTITYATAGNTQLHVAGATRAGLASTSDPLAALAKAGPTDIDGPAAPSVVAFTGNTPSGHVILNTDGTFTYVPNAGFTGTDTFTYQVTDSVTPVTGTIQITVTNRVWYVSNLLGPNNAAGGDGRSTDAFETMAAAEAASGINDIIFVFDGDSATTPLGGITLKNGQKLHGEGIGLTVAPFGILVPAGTAPRLTSAGNTVAVLANTANGDRTDVEIRGLNLSSTGGNAIDVTSADAANLGVRIHANTITGATQEGIDINHGSSGTATLAVHDNSILATGTGLDITRTAGTVTITTFDDNIVSGASGGGIVVTGPSVTFDGTPGGAYQQVEGGATAIGESGDGVSGAGMVLSNVSGDLSFVDLNVVADNGPALFVGGTGPINISAGTGTRLTAGGADLHATGGPAVWANVATIDLQLASMSSTTATNGLVLTNVNGAFSAPSGSVITKSSGSGAAVLVDNSAVGTTVLTATYSGTVTNSSASGRAVTINSADAGSTLTFAGAVTDNPGQGIALTGNTGATITFSGGLTLSTGANTAFTATGGGTIAVTGGRNVVNASGATAVDLANVTIGGAGVTFQTTSSGGGTRNVKLTSLTGGAISLGTGSLTGATGAAFLVGDGSGGANTGGTSTITYGGTITSTGTARAVDIQDR